MNTIVRTRLTELSELFDTALNKAAVTQYNATEYVKSVYITKAQANFVDSVLQAYESVEVVRQMLKGIIHSFGYEGSQLIDAGPGVFFTPHLSGVKAILFEELVTEGQLKIPVIPLNENDRNMTLKSPFRKPDKNIAYRVTEDGAFKVFHADYVIAKYEIVYCDQPPPIVLEDLPEGLSIEGYSIATISSLNADSLYKIVDLAVDLYLNDKRKLMPQSQPEAQAKK